MLKEPLFPTPCQPRFYNRIPFLPYFYDFFFTPSLCDWHVGVHRLAHPSHARKCRASPSLHVLIEKSFWVVHKVDWEVPPFLLLFFLLNCSSYDLSCMFLMVPLSHPVLYFCISCALFIQWLHAERGAGCMLFFSLYLSLYVCGMKLRPANTCVYIDTRVFFCVSSHSDSLIQQTPPQTTN